MTLGMVRHAGMDQRARESDISRAVDRIVGDNGSYGLSIDLENHLCNSPKHAIVVKTGRSVVSQFGAPSHAGMLQMLVAFDWVLLPADGVLAWIWNLGNINLEMVAGRKMVFGGHPESAVHALDVGNFHRGFKEATAVVRLALNAASGLSVMAVGGDQRS
jgi:hypothetical protein